MNLRVYLISVLSVLKIKLKLRLPHPSNNFLGDDGFAVTRSVKDSCHSWLKTRKISLHKVQKSVQMQTDENHIINRFIFFKSAISCNFMQKCKSILRLITPCILKSRKLCGTPIKEVGTFEDKC